MFAAFFLLIENETNFKGLYIINKRSKAACEFKGIKCCAFQIQFIYTSTGVFKFTHLITRNFNHACASCFLNVSVH